MIAYVLRGYVCLFRFASEKKCCFFPLLVCAHISSFNVIFVVDDCIPFYFICIGQQHIDYIVTLNKENGNDSQLILSFSIYDKLSIKSRLSKSRSYLRSGGGIDHGS